MVMRILFLLFASLLLLACTDGQQVDERGADRGVGPVKVEIVQNDGQYELFRAGRPYRIKGAGIELGDLEAFARHGGNSFRTWSTDNAQQTGQEVLDAAQRLGLTVSLGLWLKHERHEFDYDDPAAVAEQKAWVRAEVLKYKDHPALLTWIIGNELNHDLKNPRIYDAVNDISRMIHELDPNHPTTTTLAGFSREMTDLIMTRAPDLDFISLQAYGLLMALPEFVRETGFDLPFMVTEWGAVGHWEMPATSWGAPIEMDSTAKAAYYWKSYETVISAFPGQAIGSYVFLWGQKQERTPTWYGMFLETGEETEVIDVMHYIWNGDWPENRTPRLESLLLDGKTAHDSVTLKPGQQYAAAIVVTDYEQDPISYRWEIREESSATEVGGDIEAVPQRVNGLIADPSRNEITLSAPMTPGAYRLFAYAYDGMGHAAHGNIPFYVSEVPD